MALTSFGRGRDGDNTGVPPASSPPPGSASPGGLTAFIDQGSEFEGKLSFRDTVRIDGRFRGEIASENTLIVGETGEIEATIRSNMVVVSGTVVGAIHASKKVVLHKTARITGDVEAPSLVIEEGAVLRVRPKVMTVMTTILALLPIMWALGAGAGPMKRMAAPMIGGLITSTIHTLVLIPVYYALYKKFVHWRNRRTLQGETR